MWCFCCCFHNLVLELKGRGNNKKKLAAEQTNMALACIHNNTLDKNERQLSAYMHFLGKCQCCVTWPKGPLEPLHMRNPERESSKQQQKEAASCGGPIYLEYLLLSSKNISLANHCAFSTLSIFRRMPINSFCYWAGMTLESTVQRLGGIGRRKERSTREEKA